MPDSPPTDRPQGGLDAFDPPAGCVGTIAGLVAACVLAFVAGRVLSAPSSRAAAITFVAVAAALYVGMLVFCVRTRDGAHRRFARAVLVTVPIVALVLFAALFAAFSGAAIPV